MWRREETDRSDQDVVVVGAGIAGPKPNLVAVAAWRHLVGK